jgi:hypothetical protein
MGAPMLLQKRGPAVPAAKPAADYADSGTASGAFASARNVPAAETHSNSETKSRGSRPGQRASILREP